LIDAGKEQGMKDTRGQLVRRLETGALPRMVRQSELLPMLGNIRRETLFAWRKAGFPQGRKLGPNTIVWDLDEVLAWLESRPAA
jgi:predicted DNA-binding transcriptional regulator AlpA